MITKDKLITEILQLQHDIDSCIGKLVHSRYNKDSNGVEEALCRMENITIETQQLLQCIFNYLEPKDESIYVPYLEDKFREPFDVDLAKKIVSGEVEGEIRTKNNSKVRILDWNMSGRYSICAVIDEKTSGETIIRYTDYGKCNIKEHLDLVLYVKRNVQEEQPITEEWLLENGFEKTQRVVGEVFLKDVITIVKHSYYFQVHIERRIVENTCGVIYCTTTRQLIEFCKLCGCELNGK